MEVVTGTGQVYLGQARERRTCKAPQGTVGARIYRTGYSPEQRSYSGIQALDGKILARGSKQFLTVAACHNVH